MPKVHLIAAAVSLVIHTGAAFALSNVTGPPGVRPSNKIAFDLVRPPPPVGEPLAVEAEAKPPPKKAAKTPQPRAKAAIKPAPDLSPPKAERRPVFGLSLASTANVEAQMTVPLGDTVAIDPARSAREQPDARPIGDSDAQAEPAQPSAKEARAIKKLPEIDAGKCGRMISYPPEAEAMGIEGDVTLRVSLDATGRAVDVRVLRGLGHGLDETAREALAHLCRFTPAIATDGTPVPYVIAEYVFHFAIPR